MKKVDVSLITISNNKNTLQDFLDNLSFQEKITYEIIVIDNNKNNNYSSARQAYNDYIGEASGKYIIFLHPDIRFLDNNCIFNLYNYAEKIKDFGVIGIAGASFVNSNHDNRIIYSNIIHGISKVKAGNEINKPIKVQTLDECLFLVKNSEIKKNKFSNLKGWHLYAVELCLRMKYIHNKENYVVPANIWHISDGKSLDPSYISCLKELIKIYSKYTDNICTTVKKWKTKGLFMKAYLNYYYFKQIIKNVRR